MARSHKRKQSSRDSALLLLLAALLAGGLSVGDRTISSYNYQLLWIAVVGMVVGLAVIAVAIWIQTSRRQALQKLDASQIDALSGLAFEKWVAEQLRLQGSHVKLTPTNDYGVDIVATKDGIKTAVQVKRYKGKLDQKPIREAVAGMVYYHCSATMVVTNSYFTTAASTLARANNCRLVDRDELARWLSKSH